MRRAEAALYERPRISVTMIVTAFLTALILVCALVPYLESEESELADAEVGLLQVAKCAIGALTLKTANHTNSPPLSLMTPSLWLKCAISSIPLCVN